MVEQFLQFKKELLHQEQLILVVEVEVLQVVLVLLVLAVLV